MQHSCMMKISYHLCVATCLLTILFSFKDKIARDFTTSTDPLLMLFLAPANINPFSSRPVLDRLKASADVHANGRLVDIKQAIQGLFDTYTCFWTQTFKVLQ